MPQERENPYPFPTPEEIAQWASETDPATAAARQVMVRNIQGLYQRPYLKGDSDHAPILKGVRDLTLVCIQLLDGLAPATEVLSQLSGDTLDRIDEMRAILHYEVIDEEIL